MRKIITEEHVEENVLAILKSLDYDIIRGSNEEYLPGASSALRKDYQDEAQSKETTLLVHKWNRCSILCNDFIGVQM